MEELFVETKDGRVPIDAEIIRKYHLEKGSLSPFLRSRIVGKYGDFPAETSSEKDPKNSGKLENPEEKETENVTLSTSEIIDFAQGTDSSTGH